MSNGKSPFATTVGAKNSIREMAGLKSFDRSPHMDLACERVNPILPCLLAGVLMLATICQGQPEQPPETGLAESEVDDRKPLLTTHLHLENHPGTLFLRWRQGRDVELTNVEVARRGEPIAVVVLFSGCGNDRASHCNVTMNIQVIDPAGNLYGESKDTEVWVGRVSPAPGTTQLSTGYLMINIRPHDPAGEYSVQVRVFDHVSGEEAAHEGAFKVAPLQPGDTVEWPEERSKPDLSGFWKNHCDQNFGLKIELADGDLYAVSFCGPGGCFEPGTYRPNSPIFGDEAYSVIDGDTLEVLGGDGFSTYHRCGEVPASG